MNTASSGEKEPLLTQQHVQSPAVCKGNSQHASDANEKQRIQTGARRDARSGPGWRPAAERLLYVPAGAAGAAVHDGGLRLHAADGTSHLLARHGGAAGHAAELLAPQHLHGGEALAQLFFVHSFFF